MGGSSEITIRKNEDEVKMVIGSDIIIKNGEEIYLDCSPFIEDGRTLVPVRALSEALGASVAWLESGWGEMVTVSTFDLTTDEAIKIMEEEYPSDAIEFLVAGFFDLNAVNAEGLYYVVLRHVKGVPDDYEPDPWSIFGVRVTDGEVIGIAG
jgi:hypothetical protein